MARSIQNLTNVEAPSSDYPYGRVKNNTGSRNGTPVDEKLLGDVIQFFNRMMDEANISYNGLPDNDYSGFQLFTALQTLLNTLQTALTTLITNEASTRAAADTAETAARVAADNSINSSILSILNRFGSPLDFNSMNVPGLYYSNGSNSPCGGCGDGFAVQVVADSIDLNPMYQIATQVTGAGIGDIYIRNWNGSAWSAWSSVNT